MTTRYRHNDNERRVRRRLNPEYVKLRVYSSNYKYPMSENRLVVFPMELVPTEIMVKLGERIRLTLISTLTGITFIYPLGVIFKERNEYFLEISSAYLQTPRVYHDLENWDGFPEGRTEGSIKIKINMVNGALDNIDMSDGPWKFYLDEPIGIDSLGKTPLKIPTDPRALESANAALQRHEEELRRIRRMNEEERRNTFPGSSGADAYGVGNSMGGKRRRKKRTKKKSRKKKKKTLKKKRKRRNKKRKTRR